jgi:hypothetical protein
MNKKALRKQNGITSTFDNAGLLIAIVERLASKHIEYRYEKTPVPAGLKSMETSTIEAYVSGQTLMSNEHEQVNMAFESCFLFTCIRSSNSEYKMTWASSLS